MVLWSRAPMIIGIVLIASIGVFLLSSMQTKRYKASATMLVSDLPSLSGVGGNQSSSVDGPDMATPLVLLQSSDLEADVIEQLGDSASEVTNFGAKQVGTTSFIAVTASASSAELAQQAANLYATTFVEQRQGQLAKSMSDRAAELRKAADDVTGQLTDIESRLNSPATSSLERDTLGAQKATLVAQAVDFRSQATQFDIEATSRSGGIELAESAALPDGPYSPTPRRNAVMAGIVALVFAIGLAFILDRLDDRLESTAEVERLANPIPVLGAIPIHSASRNGRRKIPKHSQRALVPLSSVAAESYRRLRTSLRFSSVGSTRRTIVVTSSDEGEGKSTVVANLAVALAETGLRVVVISADLRRPSLAGIFGLEEGPIGLTDVLLGESSIEDAVQRVTLGSGSHLHVLPAGTLPSNPGEVLGSVAMRQVLDRLEAAGADYVLIDTPPVLPVADALTLAQFADGVLVVTMADGTRKGHLAESLDRLEQVHADIVGVVINAVPTKGYFNHGSYGSYGRRGYRSEYLVSTPSEDGSEDRSSSAASRGRSPGERPADLDFGDQGLPHVDPPASSRRRGAPAAEVPSRVE